MTNLYYGDLDKCITSFLSQVPPLSDKIWRSYEQKSKIDLILAEQIWNFTNFDSA